MDLRRKAFGLALSIVLVLMFLVGNYWLLFIDSQGDFFLSFLRSFLVILLPGWVLLLAPSSHLFMDSVSEIAWLYNIISGTI